MNQPKVVYRIASPEPYGLKCGLVMVAVDGRSMESLWLVASSDGTSQHRSRTHALTESQATDASLIDEMHREARLRMAAAEAHARTMEGVTLPLAPHGLWELIPSGLSQAGWIATELWAVADHVREEMLQAVSGRSIRSLVAQSIGQL